MTDHRKIGLPRAAAPIGGVALLVAVLWFVWPGPIQPGVALPVGAVTLASTGPRYLLRDRTLYETSDGDIGAEVVAQLGLDERERLALKRLYLEMQARVRRLLGPPLAVVRGYAALNLPALWTREALGTPVEGLRLVYRIDPEELSDLEEQYQASIRSALDEGSRRAFAALDQERVIRAALVGYSSSRWLGEGALEQFQESLEGWIRKNIKHRREPSTLSVTLIWQGTGADTEYKVGLGYAKPFLGGGGAQNPHAARAEPPGAVLKWFFGDDVRHLRPEILREIAATDPTATNPP
jgi:hypothetical protein